MKEYINELFHSTLAIPFSVVIALWALCFIISHLFYRQAWKMFRVQKFYSDSQPRNASPGYYIAVQIVFALVVFAFSYWVGGDSYFAFLGGGWLIATAATAANNLRSLLVQYALLKEGSVNGTISFSAAFSLRTNAQQLFAEAMILFICGLIVPNLALFGGVVFLMALGCGYLRRTPKNLRN